MKHILSALILAVALLAHGWMTKSPSDAVPDHVSKRDFAKATREILKGVVMTHLDRDALQGVDIDEVRFSKDGQQVLVEYTVRLQSRAVSQGLIFEGDVFGRYVGHGTLEGYSFSTSVR